MAAIFIQMTFSLQDDEMSWLDKSCLQLLVKRKDKPETLTFQVTAAELLELQIRKLNEM